jgi:hypothetical protein
MKTKLILLIFLFGVSLNHSYGQKYSRSQFTVFSYYVSIDEKFKSELGKVESHIKYKADKKQNKVEAMLIHTLYESLTKALSDSLGLFFLPINSMGEKAKYNDYGYPDLNITKAIRLGDTKYFLKINAYFDNEMNDSKGSRLEPNMFRPKIRVVVDIYNKYGNVAIQSSEGSVSTLKTVVVSPEFIAGMNFADDNLVKKDNSEVLKDLYNQAIAEIIAGLKCKK